MTVANQSSKTTLHLVVIRPVDKLRTRGEVLEWVSDRPTYANLSERGCHHGVFTPFKSDGDRT